MTKILIGAALGVFVGAMVAEIVRKANPRLLQKVKDRIKKGARAAKSAFMDGYAGTEATSA